MRALFKNLGVFAPLRDFYGFIARQGTNSQRTAICPV